ncbi:hypothetical protein [Spiroplasma endosymbiont of Tipula paludosa]|uniref:hypothetical protein n=1 Tax=Spiroplasma endosymbiont of Tipula paludosa TaxID=3066295 RepID=UPI0035C904DD
MKKLLAMLTTITSLSSITPIILANASAEIPENKIINKEINYQQTNNSENLNRVKKENNSNINVNTEIYWINSETSLKKETDVPYPITTMYTFTTDGGNREIGDIYFGTTNGIYLRKAGETTVTKIEEINDPVVLIQPYNHNNNGSVHVITFKGDVYYIDGNSVANKQTIASNPVITMYTFTTDGGNRKIGDIYFGTTNGIYLRKAGETTVTKIEEINDPVVLIQPYNHNNNGSVHVITFKGDVYYIDGNSVANKQTIASNPVITMYTFTTDGGNRKIGDVYFGTTNGIYLRKVGETTVTKIEEINDPVVLIQHYNHNNNGSVHVITFKGDVYYIDGNSVANKQTIASNPVITMYTFTTDGGNRKIGDIYFGTTNGIYLRKAGETTATKINGIDGPIMFIKTYPDKINSVHIIKLNLLNKNTPTNSPTLNRRANNNRIINLILNSVTQQEDFWCGPAIAEAILRYFGLQSADNNFNNQTNQQFQNTLAQRMNTQEGGTTMEDWTARINNIISVNRLNHSRTYSINNFDLAYNDNTITNRFYNLVSYSLQNDAPAAFMYHGSRQLNEDDHSHFILITGVTNEYNNAIYTYMDPWTGTFDTFNSSGLNSFLTPTRMHDDEESPLPYGGQLASFTGIMGSMTDWNYRREHTLWFNDHASAGSSCQVPEISKTNFTEAAIGLGGGLAVGTVVPIIGNIEGAIVGTGAWYLIWRENCMSS